MQEMLADPISQLILFVLIAGLLIAALVLRAKSRTNPLHARLRANGAVKGGAGAGNSASDGPDSITNNYRPMSEFWMRVAATGNQLAGSEADRAKLARLLTTAGLWRPEAVGLLVTAKYACGLLLVTLVLWGLLGPDSRFGMAGLSGGLLALFFGATLPELYIKIVAARRHESLSRSMPDALDLMIICAEVGLPFPRILRVVSRELALSAPAMAEELAYTSAELQMLPDRAEALRRLGERTRVPAVESMVGSLIQAERYGTPLAQALRTIADESRSTLILQLEEKAGKLPAQLSLPLMTMILPPVVALVATPALVRVIRTLMT